ncbi:uncharacterized protein LOC127790150 [Diospyros lotus]|uniref:uncharacterized protein LOC127790150 n=1 Tax=Diospyros lotus TaxID=55363 RepID=UPI00225C2803|nr:uncharacterized protein LOC127790150 [Diospyros lotus]
MAGLYKDYNPITNGVAETPSPLMGNQRCFIWREEKEIGDGKQQLSAKALLDHDETTVHQGSCASPMPHLACDDNRVDNTWCIEKGEQNMASNWMEGEELSIEDNSCSLPR